MENNIQTYNNLLIHENNFKNIFAKSPRCLALSLLIKAKYGSSVVYGKSFKHIANKLKISISRLMECLDDECAKVLFEVNVKNSNNEKSCIVSIKANKLYAVGKNIRFQNGGDEFFDTKRMVMGLGENVTLKKITDKLDMIQAVLLVHRQQRAVYCSYGILDSRVTWSGGDSDTPGSNREEDTVDCVFTGCSMETMSRKLGLSKYKTRTVLKEASKIGAISKRTRKIVYQGKPVDSVGSVREGGKFAITYENGKTMEQLSNEYHTSRIRFKELKRGKSHKDKNGNKIEILELRKRKSGTKEGLKKFFIPRKVKLDKSLTWKPVSGLSIPDIVNGKIVESETITGGLSYIRTDVTKEFIKSLKKSKNKEFKALAKEMLDGFSNDYVIMPYYTQVDRKGKEKYIKMCISIKRIAYDYRFKKGLSSPKEAYTEASRKFFEPEDQFRMSEIISFIRELQKFQRIENEKVKEKGEGFYYLLNDRLVKHIVADIMNYDMDSVDIDKKARPLFREFMDMFKWYDKEWKQISALGLLGVEKPKDYLGRKYQISMDAIWYFLSSTDLIRSKSDNGEVIISYVETLDRYIYRKMVELDKVSKIVNMKDYMKVESKKSIGDIVGIYG